MKTVLISGADGYIGLHLAQLLKKHNYQVLAATRSGDGDFQMDFSSPYEAAALRGSGIDTMIHTVTPNEALYKTDPYRALSENAAGIHAALDFCTANNIRHFIYFSSFHVLGVQQGRLTERTPVAPQNDYGLAHCTAEQTVQMFDRTGRVKAWIIRPSNIFGVPVDLEKFKRWNLIPFAFCKEAAERGGITLLSSGRQLRNFVGVSDVCRQVLWVLEQKPVQRIFHAAGSETMSVKKFAVLVQKVAWEQFALPVSISCPEGDEPYIHFKFTSDYPSVVPTDRLEHFVADMLQVLLQ